MRWAIHDERIVNENPHIRLSLATVELPDRKQLEQYVFLDATLRDDGSS
jgi:hypothetical protein